MSESKHEQARDYTKPKGVPGRRLPRNLLSYRSLLSRKLRRILASTFIAHPFNKIY